MLEYSHAREYSLGKLGLIGNAVIQLAHCDFLTNFENHHRLVLEQNLMLQDFQTLCAWCEQLQAQRPTKTSSNFLTLASFCSS
jgi:hypothetical protein